MRPIHAAAVAVIAMCGLGLSTPADAAPKGGPGLSADAGTVILVDDDDRDRWRDRRHRGDWDEGDDRWRDRRHRGDWDRDRGRHRGWDRGRGHDWRWGRGRGHDWRWGRGHDRRWDRWGGRRDHWRDWDRKDWKKAQKRWEKDRKRWEKQRRRWHARQHPRRHHWIGRPFRYDGYSVLRDFDNFFLPPMGPGQFYARSDNDVFLVDEATRRIIDAFVLYNALAR